MPTPIVVGIVTGYRAGNAALSGDRVRARRKYLADNRRLQTRLGQLQRSTKPGTTATDDDTVEFHFAYLSHELLPKDEFLKLPDQARCPHEVNKQHQQAHRLVSKANGCGVLPNMRRP